VDITEYREQKDKACRCHVSQGMDEIKVWHDAMEIMRGLEHHCKYGEAFIKQQWKD
jgi:LmbE family N-acetylglucosaminyl deacetylase